MIIDTTTGRRLLAVMAGLALAVSVPASGYAAEEAAEAEAEAEHPALVSLRDLVVSVLDNSKSIVENPEKRDELTQVNFELISGGVHWESFFKLVFGRAWLSLEEEQRQLLTERMKVLIARVYVNALDAFADYQIDFIGVQKSPRRDDIVSVEMLVTPPGNAKKITVQSRMRDIEGKWLGFDFITNGISISAAYKSNYRPALKKQGFDGVLKIVDKAIAGKSKAKGDAGAEAGGSGQEQAETGESGK